MSNEKITFRIDGDTKRRLGGEQTNLSGIMRNLAEKYARTGDTVESSLLVEREQKEDRLRDLERDKGDIQAEINKIERELDRIDTRLEQRREGTTDEASDIAEQIETGSFPLDNLTEDNLAVQNHAAKAGVEISEFILQVEQELDR